MTIKERNGVRQIIIVATAGLLIQIGVGIWNGLRATNQDHWRIEQNVKDIAKHNKLIQQKADADRIGEVMSLMREYHDVSMRAIETNDQKYKDELDRINRRIDDLLQKYNTIRGTR